MQPLTDGEGISSDWNTWTIGLDVELLKFGLTYTNPFHIRFQWNDNFDIPTDGFAFDDIRVKGLDYAVRFVSGASGATISDRAGSEVSEHFGATVARGGDLDGAVGSDALNMGRVRMYSLPGLALLRNVEPVVGKSGFGRAVTSMGDVNSDGQDMASPGSGLVRIVSTLDVPKVTSLEGLHCTASGELVLHGTSLLPNLSVRIDGVLFPATYASPVEARVTMGEDVPGGFHDLEATTDLGSYLAPQGVARFPALGVADSLPLGTPLAVELDNGEPGSYVLAYSGLKYATSAAFESFGWYHGLELNGV